MTMTDYIIVEEVVENEDGSAKLKVNLPEDTVKLLLNEALGLVMRCAAYGVDLQEVYDWIEDREPRNKEKDNE